MTVLTIVALLGWVLAAFLAGYLLALRRDRPALFQRDRAAPIARPVSTEATLAQRAEPIPREAPVEPTMLDRLTNYVRTRATRRGVSITDAEARLEAERMVADARAPRG